jgi:hypothetical protein
MCFIRSSRIAAKGDVGVRGRRHEGRAAELRGNGLSPRTAPLLELVPTSWSVAYVAPLVGVGVRS